MGSSVSVNVLSERTTYFPGNLVRGVVQLKIDSNEAVQFNQINLVFLSEIFQRWTTGGDDHRINHSRFTPIGKIDIPLADAATDSSRNVTLEPGKHELPFSFQLPTSVLPTVDVGGDEDGTLRVQHRIAVEAADDVAGGGGFKRCSGALGIRILSQMPAQMHRTPCPLQDSASLHLNCCGCCFDCGNVEQQIMLDRTVFALDRDRLHFRVKFDNTNGKAAISDAVVSLVCSTRPKVGVLDVAPAQTMFSETVPCKVEKGHTGECSGVLQLDALAPPSLKSSVIDVNYHIHVAGDTCCCIDEPTIRVPVQVAHSVDMAQLLAAWNAMAAGMPIIDEQQYNQAAQQTGRFELNPYHHHHQQQQQQQGNTEQIPVWQPGMALHALPEHGGVFPADIFGNEPVDLEEE